MPDRSVDTPPINIQIVAMEMEWVCFKFKIEVSTAAECVPQIPMSMIQSKYELGWRLTVFVMQFSKQKISSS